jgi:hypothetical protein
MMAAPAIGSRWKHKNGNVYKVLLVTSEPDPEKADKFPVTVIYQGPDWRIWPRRLDSWYASMTPVED